MLPINIPWKAIGIIGVVAVVALMGWRVSAWQKAYHELGQVKKQLQAELRCESGSKCQERQQILEKRASDEAEKKRKEYEQDLEDITNRPQPREPVRLCRPAAGNVRNAKPAGGTNATASQGGLQVEIGKDIARELYNLADDADREIAKLNRLQEWNASLAGEKKNE